MSQTMIEKILSNHADKEVKAGEIADVAIDARVARDFGGANVVKNLQENGLSIHDKSKTFFTFDCNPGGSDQKYAVNQHKCRLFARENEINVYDIDAGIGTHAAIDKGLILPGGTFISTDSHANIMGAIGAFGQGMGDQDIAAAWAKGSVWFKCPKSMKVILKGKMPVGTYPKDIVLSLLQQFGAAGLLGYAAEFYGEAVEAMNLSDRITIASMATEMGGIIAMFPPSQEILARFEDITGKSIVAVYADEDAQYSKVIEFDLNNLKPMIARPGHPDDTAEVSDEAGRKIDSAFLGSCTNGRYEDMKVAARLLKGKKIAPGVVLKIVPSTREVWTQCLNEGIIEIFMNAGALVGNAGCAGCAAGQIGQNGALEITISTGNRNFAGKQGKGEVYLASPATVIASAINGVISTEAEIGGKPAEFKPTGKSAGDVTKPTHESIENKPEIITGRVWVVKQDNIDTDMIFHNRYLSITEMAEMGQYAFDNLAGWEDFSQKAKPGDIIITGSNFGAGSSRQQAVDCFASLGIQVVIAKSFGSIYERNAINSGFPIVISNLVDAGIENGDEISLSLTDGKITILKTGEAISAIPFSDIQLKIYQKGGLLQL